MDRSLAFVLFVGRIWFGVGVGDLHIDNGKYMAASLRILDT